MSEFNESAMLAEFGLPADFGSKKQDDAPEPVDTPEPEPADTEQEDAPEPEQAPEPQPDPEELSARQRGWTSKEEWIAQGKNPNDWVNARHFNDKGKLIQKSREFEQLQKTFDERVNNVQKLAQMQAQMQLQTLQQENERLKSDRWQAVQYADHDALEKVDAQLMNNAISQLTLQQQLQPAQQSKGPSQEELAVEAEFERSNPWLTINDPTAPEFAKAEYARRTYQQLLNTVPDVNQRLQILQQDLAQKFPAKPTTNPNREKAPVTDSKPARTSGGELTWADLTPDERSQWNAFGESMFRDKKSFLKAVKDSRRGQ